jgi:biotin carboxyl carrier protein
MNYEFNLDNNKYKLSMQTKDDNCIVNIEGNEKKYKFESLDDNTLKLIEGNQIHKVYFARESNKVYVNIKGRNFELTEVDENVHSGKKQSDIATDGIIYPPMPGKVIKILVKIGQKMNTGDGLIIVESMKMENELNAPVACTVKAIHVSEGEQVGLTQPLIELDIPKPEAKS